MVRKEVGSIAQELKKGRSSSRREERSRMGLQVTD
jgi:hypothetical protein